MILLEDIRIYFVKRLLMTRFFILDAGTLLRPNPPDARGKGGRVSLA
jgi:hypothetical protein